MDSNLWTLLIVAGIGFAVIGGLAMLSSNYTLGNIKSKTVGDGQHGTARWATEDEIRKTFAPRSKDSYLAAEARKARSQRWWTATIFIAS